MKFVKKGEIILGITSYDLNDIIENKKIKTVFQPIISLRDSSVLTDNHKIIAAYVTDKGIVI